MYEAQYTELSGQYELEKSLFLEREEKVEVLKERLQIFNDKTTETERLFDYASELDRINMVYRPIASDAIDCMLADVINNTSKHNFEKGTTALSKAKMLFVREGEGIYTYCRKKVFMKSEGEPRRLIIRVGGGFMSLEQFIEVHNPFQNWR
jgi:hypothetical protein